MRCKECGHELPGKTIVVDGVQYETETHDFDTKLADVKIPKGWRLWKPSECFKLWENEQWRKAFNLQETWFFVEQPIEAYKNKHVARFGAYSGRAFLDCDWGAPYSYAELGVRFCRDVKRERMN